MLFAVKKTGIRRVLKGRSTVTTGPCANVPAAAAATTEPPNPEKLGTRRSEICFSNLGATARRCARAPSAKKSSKNNRLTIPRQLHLVTMIDPTGKSARINLPVARVGWKNAPQSAKVNHARDSGTKLLILCTIHLPPVHPTESWNALGVIKSKVLVHRESLTRSERHLI